MPPHLPVELVERVVAEPSLRHSDLAACCLTSRGMLHAARTHLYSRTELRVAGTSWPVRTHMWYSTVQANPHLASLVRCIKIRAMHLDPVIAGLVDVPGATLRGITEAILSPCTHLEYLAGIGTILDPPIPFPFTHSLRSIGAVSLDEQGYQLLRLLPHLRHLSILSVDSPYPVNLHPGRPTPAFRLETLQISFDYELVSVDLLSALVSNSRASLQVFLVFCATAEQSFPPLPSVQTLAIIESANDVFVAAANSCPALRTLTLPGAPLAPSPSYAALAYLADAPCVAAVPPHVTRIDLPGMPIVEDLDTLLRRLAPRGVRLATLGVDIPLGIGGLRAERLAQQEREREEAHERRRLLEPFCAQRGITLVESQTAVLPDVTWVRG
ncbi:hypothetical protein JCM10450v2_007233 [Rhodotorula kratochvilovae]